MLTCSTPFTSRVLVSPAHNMSMHCLIASRELVLTSYGLCCTQHGSHAWAAPMMLMVDPLDPRSRSR